MDLHGLHVIYINPAVLEDRWAHLHRFLHPVIKEQTGWLAITCTELIMDDHTFISCRAKNWGTGGNARLHLRYDLVDSILEVVSKTSHPVPLSPKDFPVYGKE